MKKIIVIAVCILTLSSFSEYYSTTWAGTSSNQAVTFYAAADAISNEIFSATGSSITGSYKLMTKAEAATYLTINTSYGPYAAKSSGQLVIKSDLQAPVSTEYIFWCPQVSGSPVPYTTSSAACADSVKNVGHIGVGSNYFSALPAVGDHLSFSNGAGWYIVTLNDPPAYTYPTSPRKAYQVDGSKVITAVTSCP